MYLDVHNATTYCYTGGKAFNPALPTVVFIHGVLNDHSVWILQSRYLAHHGFNVLAGWMTNERQSPTLARWLKIFRASIKALPCVREP